jgi:hypothetical protein
MDDPFKDYTANELLAYVWYKAGERGIRHALDLGHEQHINTKEGLAETIKEFRRAGLIKASEIIAEYADKAATEKEVARCYASNTRQPYEKLPESCPMLKQHWGKCYCLINKPYTRYSH